MMKKFLSILLIILMSAGLAINDAAAKRFGGGRSFGMTRSVSSYSVGRTAAAPGAFVSPARKWLGPLAGFALGGLLGHFLFGQGLGAGLLNLFMFGAILYFAMRWLRNKMSFATQPKTNVWMRNEMAETINGSQQNYQNRASVQDYPAGFHAETFLQDAKKQFLELQTAYDQKNLVKLRDTTTPDVFSEIKMQLQERGDVENKTDVIRLNTQLLDVTKEYHLIAGAEMEVVVASVLFSGLIKEHANDAASEFKEIWHLQKDTSASHWLVAGIQQH